jgi:hypothetical protein
LGISQVSAHNLLTGKTLLKPKYIDALELKYPHFNLSQLVELDEDKKGRVVSDTERLRELEKENMLLRNQVEKLNRSCADLTYALLTQNNKQEETELGRPSDLGLLHQTG